MARFKIVIFAAASLTFAAACAFFTYYTVRLIYINLTVADISRHRQPGMYIGALAFPLASVLFGYLSLRCARTAMGSAKS